MQPDFRHFWNMIDSVSRSSRRAWPVQMTVEIDLSKIAELRKKSRSMISFNAVFLKAIALAFKEISSDSRYLGFNSYIIRFPWPRIVRENRIVAGVAVEREYHGVDMALHVTIPDADSLSISEIRNLFEHYRNVAPEEDEQFQGFLRVARLPSILRHIVLAISRSVPTFRHRFIGTFLLSTVGKYGPDIQFTTPEGRRPTLGIGVIKERVIAVCGNPEVRPTTNLSMTFDRRVTNGAPAARLLGRVKQMIEEPMGLLTDAERTDLFRQAGE